MSRLAGPRCTCLRKPAEGGWLPMLIDVPDPWCPAYHDVDPARSTLPQGGGGSQSLGLVAPVESAGSRPSPPEPLPPIARDDSDTPFVVRIRRWLHREAMRGHVPERLEFTEDEFRVIAQECGFPDLDPRAGRLWGIPFIVRFGDPS